MSQPQSGILDAQPMSAGQVYAILVCVLLVALDGFDVLAIAFAAPGVSAEWSLSPGALGWVVTMELIGMGIGSAVLGNVADKIGRRPVILYSVVVITVGMALAAFAPNVYVLSVIRILTGIGIGAVLAGTNAMVAELSNNRNRSSFILFMAAGYSIGAIAGGLISAQLLKVFDWRAVFMLGAVGGLIALPLVYFLLPESLSFLMRAQPNNALEKINKTLLRYKKAVITELPAKLADSAQGGFSQLFNSKLMKITVLLGIAYFTHISTFYFVLKWVPKLVVDMGFSASQAGSVLVWANMGGLAGAIVLAGITRMIDIRWAVMSMLVGAVVFVIMFGQIDANITTLAMVCVASGFFNNAAAAGMYPLMAKYFPAEVRAGGTGVVLAIGRIGAISGPVLAGYLIQANIPLAQVTLIISIGSAMAAISVWLLGSKSSKQLAEKPLEAAA